MGETVNEGVVRDYQQETQFTVHNEATLANNEPVNVNLEEGKKEASQNGDQARLDLGTTQKSGSAYKSAYAQDKSHMRKIASAKKKLQAKRSLNTNVGTASFGPSE